MLSHNSENKFKGGQSSRAILAEEWLLCILYALHNYDPSLQIDSRTEPSYRRNGSYVSYVLHNFGPSLQIDFRVEPSYQRNGSQKCEIFYHLDPESDQEAVLEIWGSFESGLPWNSLQNFSNELQAFTCIFIFTCLRIYNSTCSSYQCYVQL